MCVGEGDVWVRVMCVGEGDVCVAMLAVGSKEGQVKSEDYGRDIASVQALLSKQVSSTTMVYLARPQRLIWGCRLWVLLYKWGNTMTASCSVCCGWQFTGGCI